MLTVGRRDYSKRKKCEGYCTDVVLNVTMRSIKEKQRQTVLHQRHSSRPLLKCAAIRIRMMPKENACVGILEVQVAFED